MNIVVSVDPFLGPVATVILSQRNVLDLAAQVTKDLSVGVGPLSRRTEEGIVLNIIVERDDLHYGEREVGPGAGLGNMVDLQDPTTEVDDDEFELV